MLMLKRLWRELAILLPTGAMQAAIQLTSFASGLLVIWLLPVHEFAYYTLANAMLGTLAVLTDCGVTQGVLVQGGRVWQRRDALGAVVACGMLLRRRLAIGSLLVAVPILYYLLRQQNAPVGLALLTSASILPLYSLTLTGQTLETVLKLRQDLLPLQRVQLGGAVLRLLTAALVILVFPYAWLASVSAGIGQAWATWRTQRLAEPLADLDAPPDRDAMRSILSQVGRMAPGAVYYAVSGQIGIWLIALFGRTDAVAQIGALGRLAMAFNVVAATISLVHVPRFSRLQNATKSTILVSYWGVQGGLLALTIAAIGLTALFPSVALAVLGPKYGSLTREITLAVAGGALSLMTATAYTMAAARGKVVTPWFVVPFAVLLQAVLALLLPISEPSGVLWLGILTSIAFWFVYVVHFTHTAIRAG